MSAAGFETGWPDEVLAALSSIPAPTTESSVTDLRSWLWSSIDNDDTRDLDQLEYSEEIGDGKTRVYVAIADVDAYVPKGSSIDLRALANSTSVYTGVETFPMLPERLSTGLTSLVENEDRLAIVIAYDVNADGSLGESSVSRALVRNKAQLAYGSVGKWLEGGTAPPKVAANEQLADLLRMQDDAAQRLRRRRHENGALELETIEARTVQDGAGVHVELTRKSRARELIEDFMIAANVSMARELEKAGAPSIARVVRKPERWNRIVALAGQRGTTLPSEPDPRALAEFLAAERRRDAEGYPEVSLSIVKLLGPGEYVAEKAGQHGEGHFGLAVADYTHSTAPNRRYSDLVVQRVIKAVIAHQPCPYSVEELEQIAEHCTERENASRKVEREMRKVTAAAAMVSHVGEAFDAVVTGDTPKGVFVRVVNPPVEGRVVRGEAGLDVGDHTRVTLLSADPERGFIDFARSTA